MKVIIIGGVAGGASCAARLRRMDEHCDILMVERGGFISYANCGLPYYIGGEIEDAEELELQTPESFNARFNVDVRIHTEAVAIHRGTKAVTLRDTRTGNIVTEGYDKLLLAPGAEPLRPALPGLGLPGVFTLRTIPDTLAIKSFIATGAPRRAVVVGGGFIGLEMAENLAHAGLSVTLLEAQNQVLAPLDIDMVWEVHEHLRRSGVDLRLGTPLEGIARKGDSLAVLTAAGEIEADLIVLALGVRPESALARDCGLTVDNRGYIVTDAHMQTSDPDIYAVGDAVQVTDLLTGLRGTLALAGPANRQGRVAADNIAGRETAFAPVQGSSIVRVFGLTACATGLSEKTAARAGIAAAKTFIHTANHATYYPGWSNLSIKVVYAPDTGRILGAQCVGFEGVDKRCDVLAAAIRAGMTAEDLVSLELCYAPPYGSAKDPVNLAAFTIQNELAGLIKSFHWHEVEGLPLQGITRLDVRTRVEFNGGYMDGFVNIPLDDLRARMGELDKSRPVYIACLGGMRGYVAARILTQNGFECYNLNGGYRLYHGVTGK